MALFEKIVNDLREKFDLGDKAGALLSALLDLVTDVNRGGFAGFLNKFDEAGLEDVSASWIHSGANTPISREQVESALGKDTLDQMARRADLDYETTVSATAFMLPRLIDELTPEGAAPDDADLRLKIGEFSNENAVVIDSEKPAETFDRIGTAAIGFEENGEITAEDDSILKWLLPLIILALLIGVGFWFCGKSAEPPVAAPPPANANFNKAASNANQ